MSRFSALADLFPKSLSGRILLVLAVGVILAQLISSTIWLTQWRADKDHNVREMSRHMAFRVASTVQFFSSLPTAYRHVVLDQLRDMGGTRFFVTLNKELIRVKDLPESRRKSIVVNEVRSVLKQQLGFEQSVRIEFSQADDLHVLNNNIKLLDLPEKWGASTLLIKPLNAPILVIQVPVSDTEWLYLATLMPDPFFLDEGSPLSAERMISLLVSLMIVLLLGYGFVRSLTKPLRRLNQAVEQFGRGEESKLEESGSLELRATARAVNEMQQRIQRYLDDRERLFASISHDLRTPITRLRLRAELLEDVVERADFCDDLEDLEMMVKASLQCVKDTDIHENLIEVDIARLLRQMQQGIELAGGELVLPEPLECFYPAKPLALKRCIGNLIDNAIFYGQRAEVSLVDSERMLVLIIRDFGPGIPEEKLERVFQPYMRLSPDNSGHPGMGLGLSIARNIARAHGGELLLSNHPEKGLVARLTLPRSAE